LRSAKILLCKKFSPIDFESEILNFDFTDYYCKEMGGGLKRQFVSFKKPIDAAKLSEIKIFTNKMEEKLRQNFSRTINIDPGYLDMSKLILATTKDYNHRIYIGRGIFAEVTLYYRGKSFLPWEWTYPDYKSQRYIDIFNKIREIYAAQI